MKIHKTSIYSFLGEEVKLTELVISRFIEKGSTIEVHPYEEKNIPGTLSRNAAGKNCEVHFFPGLLKIVVYRVS